VRFERFRIVGNNFVAQQTAQLRCEIRAHALNRARD
jgi:hypothetical protein